MQFFSTLDFTFFQQDRIFRVSRFNSILAVGIMSLLIIGSFSLGVAGGYETDKVHIPSVLCYWVGGVVAFFSLFYFPMAFATLTSRNWLMTYHPQRIAVKFRSYLHHRLDPRDIQVVVFEPGEIAGIRRVEETKASGHGDGRTVTTDYYLELVLGYPQTQELDEFLKSEYDRVDKMSGMKYLDRPVYILNPGTVRLHWNGISPSLEETIKILSAGIPVLEPQTFRHDLEQLITRIRGTVTEKDLVSLRALIKQGDVIGAIKFARTILNLGLKDAKDFVEKIKHEPDDLNGPKST